MPDLFAILLGAVIAAFSGATATDADPGARPASGAVDAVPTFVLAAEAQTDSEGVFLSQLVADHAGSALPPIRLAEAPAMGRSLTLTRRQIQTAVAEAWPAFSQAHWTGAATVNVTRRSRELRELELIQLLTETLERHHTAAASEVELQLTRPWTPILIPDEPFELRITDLPASGLSQSMVLRFELRGPLESFGTWQTAVVAKVWNEVWVATQSLKYGESLSPADLIRERRDILRLRNAATDPALFDGPELQLVQNISKGKPLLSHQFRIKPLIQRGEVVEAVVRDGALSISLKAEALEDGLPGETVRVRNLQTRREFRGTVHDEQTVLVTL